MSEHDDLDRQLVPASLVKHTNWRILVKANWRNERTMAQFRAATPICESPSQGARMTFSAQTNCGAWLFGAARGEHGESAIITIWT